MTKKNIIPYLLGLITGIVIMGIFFILMKVFFPKVDYSLQQYSTWDDLSPVERPDYEEEEAEWEYISDDIWKDDRTKLYWTSDQGVMTNNFASMSSNKCDFFSSIPRSSYDGTDEDCGDAINYCAKLELNGMSNWYLPSQKELMQAYIDGIGSRTGNSYEEARKFAEGDHYYFWSSSESSFIDSFVWFMYVAHGSGDTYFKTHNEYGVRCVSLD